MVLSKLVIFVRKYTLRYNIEAVENIVSSMCGYIFISDDEKKAQILCVKARVVERGFARDARCAKPQNI